jgi:preprotein translocase subunit SecA
MSGMFGFLKKLFGTAQGRLIKRYWKIVLEINRAEEKLKLLSDEELRNKTKEFRERIAHGETVDQLLPEAYAVVKNACRRLCGTQIHVSGYDQKWDMIPYDVQLVGAIAMHYGAIAEMQTGEGKTLTAALPLYLNALTGKPVHLVTVNDYLAQRDCEWVGVIFRWLGLNIAALTSQTPHQIRKTIYNADIVYGTSSEFGFDYLRDNSMAKEQSEQCQRGYYFAIIDEVDSILIDEARTPLIISGPSSVSRQKYDELKEDVSTLVLHQRDLCNKLATEARKVLEKLGSLEESAEKRKLSKPEEEEQSEALRKLWLVGKGMPNNKILKRLRENPDLRTRIEKWDIFYYGEQNKEERAKALSELYIIIDERSNEFELTDRGIQTWSEETKETSDASLMLDLGEEYAKIDHNPEFSEQEKMQQKVRLREEDAERKERAHNLRQLLRAHLLMEKDVDYIVSENKIVIIDENTGRPQPGRRFSDGLHQAIEAKEGVTIQGETQTYATITLQNYFRMYKKISGMTGTAMTEANEFKEIYKLEVVAIPTHRKTKRDDADDEIYMSEREKYNAILKEVQEIHAKGRPILIGTESVEVSEKLSRILKQHKLEHTVLNAKNHAKEAEIIAEAGSRGAITVATNMAGRGTDIKLKPGVAELGGLHVLGTTRHQSRRIDRQLRGRCGRQGDPGSSKFFVSFDDTLMRLFTSGVGTILMRFRPPEGEPISAKILNKSIETAQKRVEQRNYTMRKATLEYDDVMNKQREEIYAFRNEVLHTNDPIMLAHGILESLCKEMCHTFLASSSTPEGWNVEGYRQWLVTHFPIAFEPNEFQEHMQLEAIDEMAMNKVCSAFLQKVTFESDKIPQVDPQKSDLKLSPQEILKEVIRSILIRNIDKMWQEHLLQIDHLRSEVHLRTVGQKDPLIEFKHEAFSLFAALSRRIEQEIAHALFKFEMVVTKAPDLKPQGPPVAFRRPLIDLSLLPDIP